MCHRNRSITDSSEIEKIVHWFLWSTVVSIHYFYKMHFHYLFYSTVKRPIRKNNKIGMSFFRIIIYKDGVSSLLFYASSNLFIFSYWLLKYS